MYPLNSGASLFIQGFISVITIGVFYNIWISPRVYGGTIVLVVRLFGLGMLFVAVGAIERVLGNFSIIQTSPNLSLVQDFFNMIGLVFLVFGFSKLASATKG